MVVSLQVKLKSSKAVGKDLVMDLHASLPIGRVAERTGLATSAIRFYEDQGLVRSSRNAAGHRRFERSTIRRLSFILTAQRLG